MHYSIVGLPNGNTMTVSTHPAPACGDFPECHEEPPTCDCVIK